MLARTLTLACAAAVAVAQQFPPVTMRNVEIEAPSCLAFRQTGACDPDGPREPWGDRSCSEIVPCNQDGGCPSGYCECGDGTRVNKVDCVLGSHDDFKCEDFCRPGDNSTQPGLELSNGFVAVVVNLEHTAISSLRGDFLGRGNYGPEVLAAPFRLEVVGVNDEVNQMSRAAQLTVMANSTEQVRLQLVGVTDELEDPTAVEDWTVSLERGSRFFALNTTGRLVKDASIKAARHNAGFTALSIYSMFETAGVIQMKGAREGAQFFASRETLPRFYAMGGGTAVDVERSSSTPQTVTTSGTLGSPSGFQTVLVGDYTRQDRWNAGWEDESAREYIRGLSWNTELKMAPNDRNFPSLRQTTGPNMPVDDLEAYLTGIYGSTVGTLCTYKNAVTEGMQVNQAATTMAFPDRGYGGTYNYFDPDNFIALSAMIYSGDTFLMNQAKLVVERTGMFLLEDGLAPHHFEAEKPTYVALSGETQTGPNIFWTKTALQYAAASGDTEWLRGYMPTLRAAASYIFNLIDPEVDLLDAPGCLMIDVFIREHYTTDSNAMVVGFLREFASVERFLGNATGADTLEELATKMADAVNANLWNEEEDDHFITQINLDGSRRDLVDYDANLIAIAQGIPSLERSEAIMRRIDSGRCSSAKGAGPQFVGEVWYGPDDTTEGNTGDSWCSMGRIAYFDSLARRRMGELEAFDEYTLGPLQKDLIRDTWLHERYGCDGDQQRNRTGYYFEYPSIVAMLLREVRYGVRLTPGHITIDPFGPREFEFHIGNIDVSFSAEEMRLQLPGSSFQTQYEIHSLIPNGDYRIQAQGPQLECGSGTRQFVAGPDGVLRFPFLSFPECTVIVFYVSPEEEDEVASA